MLSLSSVPLIYRETDVAGHPLVLSFEKDEKTFTALISANFAQNLRTISALKINYNLMPH